MATTSSRLVPLWDIVEAARYDRRRPRIYLWETVLSAVLAGNLNAHYPDMPAALAGSIPPDQRWRGWLRGVLALVQRGSEPPNEAYVLLGQIRTDRVAFARWLRTL